MSQAIKNILKSFAFDTVSKMVENNKPVTPKILDEWEVSLHAKMKEENQKIGKASIREILVCYILEEFDITAFGVERNIPAFGEISDNCIKRMKSQHKKGFCDLKIVKRAQ